MFEVKNKAEINAINIAKGNNEESPVCVTIGLKFDHVDAGPVCGALGCRDIDLDKWFSENGDSVFSGITHISTWAEFKDEHSIKMLGFTCPVSKVSKIELKPLGNKGFALTCNVQLQNPPEHVIEKVAGALHEFRAVKLSHQSQLPLDQGDSNVTDIKHQEKSE